MKLNFINSVIIYVGLLKNKTKQGHDDAAANGSEAL